MTDRSDPDQATDKFQWVVDSSEENLAESSKSDEEPLDRDVSEAETTDLSRVDDFIEQYEEQQDPDPRTASTDHQRSTATSDEKTRLWDSFSAETSTETNRDHSEPASDRSQMETDNRFSQGSLAGSTETTTLDSNTEARSPTDPSKSFETILNRISHRTGEANQSDTSDITSTEPGSDHSESDQSGAIDEVLNNIDLFARATSSSQVLLLSPTAHSMTNDIYTRFLLPTNGAGQNVLFVSAIQSAGDQLSVAHRIHTWSEGQTAIIEVGQNGSKRSQPRQQAKTESLDIYKQISNLQNLAKLGVNISHIVSQWSDNRRPTVVGVHTLSAIQQYVGNETMFQFLFTLKGQLNSLGVMGFYHMDPASHSTNEINTIKSAFDLVIEISSDGIVDID
jgi:hypothetical protein